MRTGRKLLIGKALNIRYFDDVIRTIRHLVAGVAGFSNGCIGWSSFRFVYGEDIDLQVIHGLLDLGCLHISEVRTRD